MMIPTTQMTDAFKLKMRTVTLPILQILDNHLDILQKQLEALKIKTPNLFQNVPMILDLEALSATDLRFDLSELCSALRKYGIIPVGIQMIKKEKDPLADLAKKIGMAIFNAVKHENHLIAEQASPKLVESAPPVNHNYSRLITKPIRSGQQVYAEGGDLIVLSSVSHGAELLADGNIHVYGALRGRALAGIQGNSEARIFCQSLEADLLSIAGRYMVSEVIQRYQKKGMQQIYLENDKLQINAFN